MSADHYAEEQTNELQALESMYPNELEIVSQESPITFNLQLTTEDYQENEIRLTAKLQFVLPAKYPDEMPTVDIIDYDDDFEESFKERLLNDLKKEMPNNVGMVMVFTLVAFTNEWLISEVDKIKKQIQDEKDEVHRKREEDERKKFEGLFCFVFFLFSFLFEIKINFCSSFCDTGTRVTLESFMAWKANYDAETGKSALKKAKESVKKLTGRQLFERDATLANSDLAFIKDGEAVEGVNIDETLFQELEDLNLDDEDEGSDYNPNEFTDSYSEDDD